MKNTQYDKIELHEMVEIFTISGLSLYGEVAAKDEEWIAIFDSSSNVPVCVARKHICAFRVFP